MEDRTVTIDLEKINRLEVINHAENKHEIGRLLVMYQEKNDFKKIEISIQDEEKTLKIFIS